MFRGEGGDDVFMAPDGDIFEDDDGDDDTGDGDILYSFGRCSHFSEQDDQFACVSVIDEATTAVAFAFLVVTEDPFC